LLLLHQATKGSLGVLQLLQHHCCIMAIGAMREMNARCLVVTVF
jgi:hypothetical protein